MPTAISKSTRIARVAFQFGERARGRLLQCRQGQRARCQPACWRDRVEADQRSNSHQWSQATSMWIRAIATGAGPEANSMLLLSPATCLGDILSD